MESNVRYSARTDAERGLLVEKLAKIHADCLAARQEARYKNCSSMLLVCTTLFSVVVSIHTSAVHTCRMLHWVFQGAVVLNALCISCWSLMLYSRVKMDNDDVHISRELLQTRGSGLKRTGDTAYCTSAKYPWWYPVAEKTLPYAFTFMVLLYTIYAVCR